MIPDQLIELAVLIFGDTANIAINSSIYLGNKDLAWRIAVGNGKDIEFIAIHPDKGMAIQAVWAALQSHGKVEEDESE